MEEDDEKFFILLFIGVLIIIAYLNIPNYEGRLSDISEPSGAIEFAYDHMLIKQNVTFVEIEPNLFEGYWERHYWVTDTEGNTYRLVWSKMHREIELNKSYTIKYMDSNGVFKSLWEYE